MAPCSYAIEATCHAPDREGCYAEIFRVVKPGGLFACYEWATTDHYDPRNKEHQAIIENIQVGNGLPGVRSTRDVLKVGGEKMRLFFFILFKRLLATLVGKFSSFLIWLKLVLTTQSSGTIRCRFEGD